MSISILPENVETVKIGNGTLAWNRLPIKASFTCVCCLDAVFLSFVFVSLLLTLTIFWTIISQWFVVQSRHTVVCLMFPLFIIFQKEIVPSSKRFHLRELSFDDNVLTDRETCLAVIRMFQDLKLISRFRMDYKVS